VKFLRGIRFVFYKIYFFLFKYKSENFNIKKVLQVLPHRIKYRCTAGEGIILGRGKTKSGDCQSLGEQTQGFDC
jgi:hypothetical protein